MLFYLFCNTTLFPLQLFKNFRNPVSGHGDECFSLIESFLLPEPSGKLVIWYDSFCFLF